MRVNGSKSGGESVRLGLPERTKLIRTLWSEMGQKRTSRPRCSRQQGGAVMRPGIGLVGTGLASRTAPLPGEHLLLSRGGYRNREPDAAPKAEGDRPGARNPRRRSVAKSVAGSAPRRTRQLQYPIPPRHRGAGLRTRDMRGRRVPAGGRMVVNVTALARPTQFRPL